jgi:polyisoprenoid-binding protein YceI
VAESFPRTSGVTTEKVDGAHNHNELAVRHLIVSIARRTFGKVGGILVVDHEYPANSNVDVAIDVSTTDKRNEARDTHLQSADQFDVQSQLKFRLKRTSVVPGGDDTSTVNGDLTICGVVHSVTLDFEAVGLNKSP